MAIKRPDTPLAMTPDPVYNIKSNLTSTEKQKNSKYSVVHKGTSSISSPNGSGISSLNVQKEKENGKIKYKSYDVSTNEKGNPTTLQITRKTNTGNSRTRVITNPKKIERKMERVLRRNQ